MIKYLGIYQSVRPVELGKVLYAYEQENEIIINYDESEPFRIHHLSIEVDCVIRNRMPFTSYQVFEVEMFAQTKEEAILLAQEFSKNILKLREDLFNIFLRHQQS
jgi:hypothetical protein